MPELLKFADWAFGPEGLPELDILAYGDFSHRDRQPNILMCRSRDLTPVSKPHRQLTKKDVKLWEVVQDNLDLLEACPEDYLLHPW